MATPTEIKRRGRFGLILGVILATMALAAMAYADVVSNNLDPSVDAVAEVMPLIQGGASGTTQLYVVPRNGDGKNGCNLTGGTALTISVSSSDTSVATISPSSITFTSCGDTPILTVTPHNVGSAAISASQSSNNTGATFELAPVTFTVNVAPPPNTPPHVSVVGVSGGASYNKGSVPSATCQVTDAEDGTSSFAATLSAISGPHSSDGIGEQAASCSYTDAGGVTASVSETYGIVDPSPPVIGHGVSGTLGNNDWYISDVLLEWSVNEPESPNSLQTTGCVDQNITADQAETIYSCSASSAGGAAGPVSVSVKRDASAPTIDCGTLPTGWQAANVVVNCAASDVGPSGLANPGDASFQLATNVASGVEESGASAGSNTVGDNAGNQSSIGPLTFQVDRKEPTISCGSADGLWHGDDVSVACTASDGGSGLAKASEASFPLATNVPQGTETNDAATATKNVSDAVGNSASAGPITGNKVDKKGPSVTLSCPSAPVLKGGSASASWSASDGGSGLVGAAIGSISLDAGSVGPHTTSLAAGFTEDAVGNGSAAASCAYSVIYNWSGFFQPIENKDANGNYILNKAKAGATIPVKFSLDGYQGMSIFAAAFPSSGPIACSAALADTIEEYSTATVSGLKYDAGQYIYNWKTDSSWSGSCRQLVVKLDDGRYYRASFSFMK